MTNERFDNLSEDLKAKAIACNSPEELQDLAKSQGVELSLDDLDEAAGGWNQCPRNECTLGDAC